MLNNFQHYFWMRLENQCSKFKLEFQFHSFNPSGECRMPGDFFEREYIEVFNNLEYQKTWLKNSCPSMHVCETSWTLWYMAVYWWNGNAWWHMYVKMYMGIMGDECVCWLSPIMCVGDGEGDMREISGRFKADCREMSGRFEGDGGRTQGERESSEGGQWGGFSIDYSAFHHYRVSITGKAFYGIMLLRSRLDTSKALICN